MSGLVQGQKYTVEIEGILGKDSTEAVVVKKAFTAKGMKTQSKVGKATVESKKFVVLKMQSAAYYKDATVSVADSNGLRRKNCQESKRQHQSTDCRDEERQHIHHHH